MHDSVMAWGSRVLTQELCMAADVIEVGSYDVNGTLRPLVERWKPRSYVGIDMQEGPGVDIVADITTLTLDTFPADLRIPPNGADILICTEMMEHVLNWRDAIINMTALLAPYGTLILTTRSPGMQYHGYPDDYWRYYRADIQDILNICGYAFIAIHDDPQPNHPGVFAQAIRVPRMARSTAEMRRFLDSIKLATAPGQEYYYGQ